MKNIFDVGEEILKQLDLLKISIEHQYGDNLVLEFNSLQLNQGSISMSPRGCSGNSCTGQCQGGCLHSCKAACMQSPFGIM